MIESITMKNVATYDSQGVTIDKLGKVNFIYGANASGKTTISNFIVEDGNVEKKYNDCVLKWENNLPMKTLVYNKQFREQNFRETISGVFTLGQATQEEIDRIDEKRKQLEDIKKQGIEKKNSIEELQKQQDGVKSHFQEHIWSSVYKKYETDFAEAFNGVKAKERFKNKLLDEALHNQSVLQTIDSLKERAKTIFGTPPVSIEKITTIEYSHILDIEKSIIWSKKIIGKSDVDIAALIHQLNINDWVNAGRKYIQEDSDVCPFCQQHTISVTFKKQLETYFDATFNAEIRTINQLYEEYITSTTNIITQLQYVVEVEKVNINTKIDLEKLTTCLAALESLFSSNKQLVETKKKEPSRSIELLSTKQQLDAIQTIIMEANIAIQKHNKIVDDYVREKKVLINEIWKYLVEENKIVIDDFNRNINGKQTGIEKLSKERNNLREQYNILDLEIKNDSKNITSIQPTINDINIILKSYGFTNFTIVPTEDNSNCYQIRREDGSLANSTLSEGEVTFITFLYFYKLIKGGLSAADVPTERVLVIDDPISSLDSTILFVVSSLIKEIIKEIKAKEVSPIKQLILLTHNVYFHKEVSYVDGRKTDKLENQHRYWILHRENSSTNITAYDTKNPIQNSYELLWQELRNEEHLSLATIQNTMRRILETYFKILGDYNDDGIIESFDNRQEREICRSLLCWINDGSHCIPDSLYIEQSEDLVDKYKSVFRKIFEVNNQIGHYKMMMKTSEE